MKMWYELFRFCNKLNDIIRQQIGFDGGDPESINAFHVVKRFYQIDKAFYSCSILNTKVTGVDTCKNYFPGVCSLYVDIRTPPGLRPVRVLNEIRQTLDGLGIDYQLEPYRSLLGHEGQHVEPLVESLNDVSRYLFGKPFDGENSERASIWTDTNVYNEVGIPCVKVGPRGKRHYPRLEEVEIETLVKATRIYVLATLDICNRPRG